MAYYNPEDDQISCPAPHRLQHPNAYYPTMFHEMGHSTGAKDRLNRDGIVGFDSHGSHQYSNEELVAEMTSAYLCGHYGLSMDHLENSSAYIQHWYSKLDDDPEILTKACTEAEKAYQYILHGEVDDDLKGEAA